MACGCKKTKLTPEARQQAAAQPPPPRAKLGPAFWNGPSAKKT